MNGATGTIQKPIFRDKMKSKSGKYFNFISYLLRFLIFNEDGIDEVLLEHILNLIVFDIQKMFKYLFKYENLKLTCNIIMS